MRKLFKEYWGISPFFLISFIACALLFYLKPEIDLETSSLFFKDNKFYMANRWWALLVYYGVQRIATPLTIITLLIMLIWMLYKKSDHIRFITKKTVIYMLAVMILGPGLTVNYLLKSNFGRARPANIEEFGGKKKFTPAFVLSRECKKNCSFVSGHATFGFYWFVLFFLCTNPGRRKYYFTGAFLLGFLIGIIRVIQGRHFISDVVFAFFFIYLVASLTYYFMYKKKT